ncbi:MAG: 3-hydroxyacyl-CoA dehydrogenase family protein [SAR202 cluster bacterium]|nr:3-hydroxyacyl-CoA dehydrogenase family protein [SAR202 cluster bacterium]
MQAIHKRGEPLDASDIRRITVVGAGLMGHGIALEFALRGYQVTLNARTDESLTKAMEQVRKSLARMVSLGMATDDQSRKAAMSMDTHSNLALAVADADLVIESVVEDLAIKRHVFRQLDGLCPARTILASNSSAIMPSALAQATGRPEKVIDTHYINPPYLVPLVEVVRGPDTSDETADAVMSFLREIGKRPILIEREVPGFVASRLQAALLREALWLVQNGVASAADVDRAIKDSLGRRWAVAGVFEVLELAGWDLLAAIAANLFPHLADDKEVPDVLADKVDNDELGVKTGQGFYKWTPESAEALRQRIAYALTEI